MSKEGFDETKTTTVKMFEPYKIKLVPFAKGYRIELSLNGNDYLADAMKDKSGPIIRMIQEAKNIIKDELKSNMISDETQ